jgi:hypothetical protein
MPTSNASTTSQQVWAGLGWMGAAVAEVDGCGLWPALGCVTGGHHLGCHPGSHRRLHAAAHSSVPPGSPAVLSLPPALAYAACLPPLQSASTLPLRLGALLASL